MPFSNFIRNFLLTITEIGMLFYWLIAGAVALQYLNIPAEYMYSDADNPLMVAWNWSFFPIDVAFALTGLASRYLPVTEANAGVLKIIGLSLMFSAGLMAIVFWTITGDFNPSWWAVNIWLIALSAYLLTEQIICPATDANTQMSR